MSAVADNAAVAEEPTPNGHHLCDGLNTLEISNKLATDEEVVYAAADIMQDVAVGAEDVPVPSYNNDDSLVTSSSDDTLTTETSEVLNVVRAALCSLVGLKWLNFYSEQVGQ